MTTKTKMILQLIGYCLMGLGVLMIVTSVAYQIGKEKGYTDGQKELANGLEVQAAIDLAIKKGGDTIYFPSGIKVINLDTIKTPEQDKTKTQKP